MKFPLALLITLFAGSAVAQQRSSTVELSSPNGEASVLTTEQGLPRALQPREDLLIKQTRAEENRDLPPQAVIGSQMSRKFAEQSVKAQTQSTFDGAVVLNFGASLPTIAAAVLQVTDIELEAGETVSAVVLGDTARWSVTVTNSNEGQLERPHLIIKPADEGLKTTLVVTTSKRTYHLVLQSDFERFMHHVRFQYGVDPEQEMVRKQKEMEASERARMIEAAKIEAEARLPKPILPGAPVADIGYEFSGRTTWRPVSAYTDGVKTYIDMPATMKQTEAPSLYALRKSPGWFKKDERLLVNYRVQNNQYIVDAVLDRAEMLIGNDKVTITKVKRRADPSPTKLATPKQTKVSTTPAIRKEGSNGK